MSSESLLSASALVRKSISFSLCARPGRCIAEVKRHTYSQFPVTYRTNRITQVLCYVYVEWMVDGIEPRTFRLQGELSTDSTELTGHRCVLRPPYSNAMSCCEKQRLEYFEFTFSEKIAFSWTERVNENYGN